MPNSQDAVLFLKSEIDRICGEHHSGNEPYTKDEKSIAFSRWFCENILFIPKDKIDDVVAIDGGGDYSVDLFDIQDTDNPEIVWAQVKHAENLDHEVTRPEMVELGQTPHYLKSKPVDANAIFKQKSTEFNQVGGMDSEQYSKRIIFVVAGKLGSQAQNLIETPEWKNKFKNNKGLPINFEVYDLERILDHIEEPITKTLKIKFDAEVLTRKDKVNSNEKSIIGYVDAKIIKDIVKNNIRTIFLINPREAKKNTKVNKEILATLQGLDRKKITDDDVLEIRKKLKNNSQSSKVLTDDEIKDQMVKNSQNEILKFWKLNQGITAACAKIEPDTDPNAEPHTFIVENLKILNGRQTTQQFLKSTRSLDGAEVEMKIHETLDPEERHKLSGASNLQNALKAVDYITNLDELNALVIQCKQSFKDFYFERQSKGFDNEIDRIKNTVTKRRVLEKNATARAYYAYAINPQLAMMSDDIFYSEKKPEHYNLVFENSLTDPMWIKQLIIPHIFYQMLQGLKAKWTEETKETPPNLTNDMSRALLTKDIVKFYILRFIWHSMHTFNDSDRIKIEDKIIETFRTLGPKSDMPPEFISIAKVACANFLQCFKIERAQTWPTELYQRVHCDPSFKPSKDSKADLPTTMDVKNALHKASIPLLLLGQKADLINSGTPDGIADKLKALISNT